MNIPRTIEIIRCSVINAWYQDLIGVSFAVMDRCGDSYIVDEYDWTSQMLIPKSVKITDCKILER